MGTVGTLFSCENTLRRKYPEPADTAKRRRSKEFIDWRPQLSFLWTTLSPHNGDLALLGVIDSESASYTFTVDGGERKQL
ncbi:hypothetical protein J6590_015427 [Homalodisca vitripennis]|nr:hypothetical protein J6590_015427 [Homalodisca vitripennis]